MKTYNIEIERDEAGYWIATVPEVPGVVTQAKRLEKIVDRAREAIAVLLDKPETSFDVSPHVRLLDDVPIADAVKAREHADAAQAEATEKGSYVVERLVHEKALTVRDAGQLLGISHQRVQQIVQREQLREPTRESAVRAGGSSRRSHRGNRCNCSFSKRRKGCSLRHGRRYGITPTASLWDARSGAGRPGRYVRSAS